MRIEYDILGSITALESIVRSIMEINVYAFPASELVLVKDNTGYIVNNP